MTTTTSISLSPTQQLPAGYRYGAHVSGVGSEGYHVIREADGASLIAWQRPDCDEEDVEDLAEQLDELLGETPA